MQQVTGHRGVQIVFGHTSELSLARLSDSSGSIDCPLQRLVSGRGLSILVQIYRLLHTPRPLPVSARFSQALHFSKGCLSQGFAALRECVCVDN